MDRLLAQQINLRLAETYPDAHCELEFASPFQLLVATVLSAQTTDRRVNAVTPELFASYPGPVELAAAEAADVERIIGSIGCFRVKTASLIGLSRMILDDFDGEVPNTLEELILLPGVGRKTANVVLGNAFGVPGITPDTHMIRLANRFGWVDSKNPDRVEQAVAELFAPKHWVVLCHRVIWHGRRCCHSRRPACGACPVAEICPSFGIGEVNPAKALTMLREPRG